MQDIKFRIWDEKYKEWQKSPILVYPGEPVNVQGRVIQMFTGLKDKHGKEIYDGDLVGFCFGPDAEAYYGKYKVFYNERWAAYYVRVIEKSIFDPEIVTLEEAKERTIEPRCPVMAILEVPLGPRSNIAIKL